MQIENQYENMAKEYITQNHFEDTDSLNKCYIYRVSDHLDPGWQWKV